jgi:hypothetical protein
MSQYAGTETSTQEHGTNGAGSGDIDREALERELAYQQLQQQSLLQERWNEELRQQLVAREEEERSLKEMMLARLRQMEAELQQLSAQQYAHGAQDSQTGLNTRELLRSVEELNAMLLRSLDMNPEPVEKAQHHPPQQQHPAQIARGEQVPGFPPGFTRPAPGTAPPGFSDEDIIIGPALPTDRDSAPRIYYLHTARNQAKIPLPPPSPAPGVTLAAANTSVSGAGMTPMRGYPPMQNSSNSSTLGHSSSYLNYGVPPATRH